jgi:hypothetical protein
MDFSKLSANDKLAVYGAAAAIVGSFISISTGTGSFGLLSGILMLVIIFLPQFSPGTKLPGSKGSLMLLVGGAGSLFALLALLAWLPYLGVFGGIFIGLLISIAGGLVMGWASWKEFQAEGGKFTLGMASSAPPAPPAAPPAPPAEPMSAPMSPPPAAPMSDSMSQPAMGDHSEDEPTA